MAKTYGHLARKRKERVLNWQREQTPAATTCSCGKKRFPSRKKARQEARRWQGKGSWSSDQRPRVYECGTEPGVFHITSVGAGRIEYYREKDQGGKDNG